MAAAMPHSCRGGGRVFAFGLVFVVLQMLGVGVNGITYNLPGVTPVEYSTGEAIVAKVSSVRSTKTAIPFDYYSLMFCRPPGNTSIKADVENFGDLLWGTVIKPAPYLFKMRQDVKCQKLCKVTATAEKVKPGRKPPKVMYRQLKRLKQRIDDEYRGHLILDALPVTEVFIWGGKRELYYKPGYPLGYPGNKTSPSYINNHLSFTVKYHKPEDVPGYRIVGFEVAAHSVSNAKIESECRTDNDDDFTPERYPPQAVVALPNEKATTTISFSYSVRWVEDRHTLWATRWDAYLQSTDSANAKIHWFSIVSSLFIVMLLSVMVAGILLRSLHKDFNRYNATEEDDLQEETGWKLVHRDVFRTPTHAQWLCVFVGTGSQLLAMSFITLGCALVGFLTPANRGGLLTALLIIFVLMGVYGGFMAARLAKMFHKMSWFTVGLVAVWFPGMVFGVFLTLDILLWSQGASSAVRIFTILWLFGLWLFVSVPLVFVGGAVGYKAPLIEHPLTVQNIPRAIPEQMWWLRPHVSVLLSGVVPFGAAFIELWFILSSLWLNKFYYVFGFLALVVFILFVTCAEISIVLTYFTLCYEDWRWWWRAFNGSAAAGVWLFVYSIFYFVTTLKIKKFISIILYFGWMSMLSTTFAVMCGTVGFLSSLLFVRKIYAQLKVD